MQSIYSLFGVLLKKSPTQLSRSKDREILHGDEVDKERNWIALVRIGFHLDEAMRFCNQLDLSGLGPLEQTEWDSRMKTCKDAIQFTRESLKGLSQILE